MDLLHGKVKILYLRYLTAAFGSALISSIYGVVDMAMVGQYHGPEGTAALAVVAPVWNIIYSLGLLNGIGGSVLFGLARGRGLLEEEHQAFTAALLSSLILAVLSWGAVILFDRPLLLFFGSDHSLLPLAQAYLLPVKFTVPAFLFNQMLAAFLRSDGDPALATGAVLFGGIFNIFGDYFFVFVLDMGIFGAGLATAIGAVLTLLAMLVHFFRKSNTLHLVRPTALCRRIAKTWRIGFSSFFVDIAMGILTILFNRQIIRYLNTDALAVYGIIINISTFVQCCAYSVGQAAQPIFSVNFGAGRWRRIREVLHCALCTCAFFGLVWTALALFLPNAFVHIFMEPTQSVLAVAPSIIHCYGLSFLLLPFNIFSTYYFQSILKPGTSMLISVARGMLLSGAFILLLPMLAGPDALWLAMPVTELLIAVMVLWRMQAETRALGQKIPS